MKQGLQEINDLVGVWGSLVCDNQGKMIAGAPPPALNDSILENISQHCVELLSTAGEHLQGLEEMILYYQQRRLFLHDLEDAVLIVMCTPSIDISLLRLTVNVVLTRWESDPKIQKLLKD